MPLVYEHNMIFNQWIRLAGELERLAAFLVQVQEILGLDLRLAQRDVGKGGFSTVETIFQNSVAL